MMTPIRTFRLIILWFLLLFASLHSQTLTISGPGVYTFPSTHIIIDFKTVPQGGGMVTVNEFLTLPTPAPQGGTVVSYYLDISTNMPDNSFTALIQIENAASLGLSASTIVEMQNIYGDGWLISSGNYTPGVPDFYRFRVNRFSIFAFLDPLVQPKNVYLSAANVNPASSLRVYPTDIGGLYGSGDWGYTSNEQYFSIYVKPEDQSQFYGCDIHLQWDDAVIEFQSVSEGNVWPPSNYNFFTYPQNPTNSLIIQATAQTAPPVNITAGVNDYIAKLDFKMNRPGFTIIEMVKYEFRDELNSPLYFFNSSGKVKYFLGDFTDSFDETTGDGQVDFDDLILLSLAYNSTTTGWSGTEWLPSGTFYKRKYDIGPTDGAHFIFDIPLPDNKIDFEDLIIFSFSYGYSNEQIYPDKITPSPLPFHQEFRRNSFEKKFPKLCTEKQSSPNAGLQCVPISIPGIPDLKGFSFTFELMDGAETFNSIEKVNLIPENGKDLTFLLYNLEGNYLTVDGVILNKSRQGIDYQGPLFYLNFKNTTSKLPAFRIVKAIIRDSHNKDYPFELEDNIVPVPEGYLLTQNYPNPFNGNTKFEVNLPHKDHVEISVYNTLGQKVSAIFEGNLSRGIHTFSWVANKGMNDEIPSGIYFLLFKTPEFSQSRKMFLIK